ncbi:MAG: class I SAM-dependent methyltransferase [archaeon]
MNSELVLEVKKKKEFSQLPNSIIKKVLDISGGDVKEARALLRKYFGVFLTHKVLKGKDVLANHFSSKKRDYGEFYGKIFGHAWSPTLKQTEGLLPSKDTRAFARQCNGLSLKAADKKINIIDLGCGVNGFSYLDLKKVIGNFSYLGVEASGQIVDLVNSYFSREKIYGKVIRADLFNLDFILELLKGKKGFNIVFMFQLVDALENLEKNYSLKLIKQVMKYCDLLVISLPTESLGGRRKFVVKRKWLLDFLVEGFVVINDFEISGERVFVVRKK